MDTDTPVSPQRWRWTDHGMEQVHPTDSAGGYVTFGEYKRVRDKALNTFSIAGKEFPANTTLVDRSGRYYQIVEPKDADTERDALRWRWWLKHMTVARDEIGSWTCWVAMACVPFRSKTESVNDLTDSLIERFPDKGVS